MNTVKTGKKSKKKLIVTLSVIVVVIVGLCVGCSAMVNSARDAMMQAMNAQQTDLVTVRALTKSIGATGKVVSLQSKDVSAALSGVEITDVAVEVGDSVTQGQILVQLDTEDIAEKLAAARRALSQTQGQYAISAENAQRQVDDALRGGEYSVEMAETNVEAAYKAYLDAWDALEDAEEAEDDAYDAWVDAEDELEKIEKQEDALPAAIEQAEMKVQQAEAAYEQAQKGVEQAAKSIDTLYDQYETAQKNYENTVATGESSVASAQAAQQSAALSVNTDQQQMQIDALAEQLEDGVLTAPFDGIVTAVNYDPGDTYLQGAIVTVQDCSGFEVKAQIGEYDISDIALGQKVLIKTEATREQELEGTVVFVSPTATVDLTGMQTDPTYEVRIRVDTASDRLRLDMSATLSIIIRQVEDALTVPYNAVQTAEDGSTFVEVVHDDETTTTVPVEVVMESNYYTQIRGDVKEGQTVRLVRQQGTDIFAEMMEMSPMAGGF